MELQVVDLEDSKEQDNNKYSDNQDVDLYQAGQEENHQILGGNNYKSDFFDIFTNKKVLKWIIITVIGLIGLTIVIRSFKSTSIYEEQERNLVKLNSSENFSGYYCENCQRIVTNTTTTPEITLFINTQYAKEMIIQAILQKDMITFKNDFEDQLTKDLNDEASHTDLAVVMASIIVDVKKPAYVLIGQGFNWEEALYDLVELIISYDFQDQINLIKLDFIGNYGTLIQQVDGAYYFNTNSKNTELYYKKTQLGLFVESVFIPTEFNTYGLTENYNKKDKSLHNKIKINKINQLLSQLDQPKTQQQDPYIYTYETLLSFYWENPTELIQSQANGLDKIEQNIDSTLVYGKVFNLERGRKIYDEEYQINKNDIYKYLNSSDNFLRINFQDKQNKFSYQYFAPTNQVIQKNYNLLRHSGTIMALCQIYESLEKNPQILEVARSGIKYLQDRKTECPNTKNKSICLHDEQNNMKLGGNGLSLVAMATYTKITNDKQYMDFMESLARRIIEVQTPDGKFDQHIVSYPSGKYDPNNTVLFYIGESMLGLMKLYDLKPRDEYLTTVKKGLDYIIQDQDFDHWLMYAINEYSKIEKVDAHIQFAIQKSKSAIERYYTRYIYLPDFAHSGSSLPGGSSIGTYGEGLMQVYELLKRFEMETELQEKIIQTVNHIIKFQNYMQFKTYNTLYFPERVNAMGGIVNNYLDLTVQIDNNQHQASSQIAYLKYLNQQNSD